VHLKELYCEVLFEFCFLNPLQIPNQRQPKNLVFLLSSKQVRTKTKKNLSLNKGLDFAEHEDRNHGLINFINTKAKRRHLKSMDLKRDFAYQEIQSVMLVLLNQLSELLPLYCNLLSD
jgi:hypothetical protein